jgi:hypothetical protein
MAAVKFEGSPTGTGTVTIAAPATNTNRVLTLPAVSTAIAGTNAAQTLTDVTLGAGTSVNSSLITQTAVVNPTGGGFPGTLGPVLFTGLPPWIIRLSLIMYQVSLTTNSRPVIQFGTGSTPTYVTSGYSSGSDNYGAALGTVTTATNGFLVGRIGGATYKWNCIYTFIRMSADSNVWVGSMRLSTDGVNTVGSGGGYVTLDAPLSAIQLSSDPIGAGLGVYNGGSVSLSYG